MVLSKFPIVDYQVVLLPRHMDDKRYCVVHHTICIELKYTIFYFSDRVKFVVMTTSV